MTFYNYKRILRESIPALSVLLAVELVAGHVLNQAAGTLLAIPFLLILVPVVNGIGGNIGTVLGARLTSGLYTGTIAINLRDRELLRNTRDAVLLYLITFSVLAMFIYGIAYGIGVVPPFGAEVLLFIMLSSGMMLAGVLILVTISVALLSFSKGLDPDNLVTPLVTTAGDFLGIVFLVSMVAIFL
ncbi:MAG: magnesium transporter [Thermoplasmata archaeon]